MGRAHIAPSSAARVAAEVPHSTDTSDPTGNTLGRLIGPDQEVSV